MNNSAAQFSLLKQRCDGRTSEAIERLLCKASDFCVNRINPLAFAVEAGLDETACIGAFLHATQIGIVDLAWNVVCGGCGGILHSANSLKAINDLHYRCGLCAADCQTMLDDSVEVTFTVSPKLRPISAQPCHCGTMSARSTGAPGAICLPTSGQLSTELRWMRSSCRPAPSQPERCV